MGDIRLCYNYETKKYEEIDRNGYSHTQGKYVDFWDDSAFREEEEKTLEMVEELQRIAQEEAEEEEKRRIQEEYEEEERRRQEEYEEEERRRQEEYEEEERRRQEEYWSNY